MTSLTRVSIVARKIIRYSVFFLVFLIVGRIFLNVGVSIYRKIFPPAPPAPTVKFGRLPKIPFPENSVTTKLSYVLETPEGGLPTTISTQAKVFFMPKANSNLLSLDVAKEKAKALGFTSEAIPLSDTIYKFMTKDSYSALQMNIITGNFSISYNLAANSAPLNNRPQVAEIAAARLRSILSSANVLPADLTGATLHEYLKLSEGKLVSALSLSEASVVKINLFRKDYDKLPSVTGSPNQANVWAIMAGSSEQAQQIIAAEYHYYAVDESQSSTYPVKTPEAAWNEFINGKAFIASIGVNKDGDTVKVRRVYLAYFDPAIMTEFYQPIYVFEGDNGFSAYLPAVTSDYYGE